MQLQHFLSLNKTNIKHSCKSQLYKIDIGKGIPHDLKKILGKNEFS